jgi:S-adenosylmethionine hydrolase
MHRPVITLTTDFGLADAYVGAMKGVILGICPQAVLVDLSHTIPPQDVRAASFILASALPYFPEATVHLVVVDPGVGSDRRAIAAQGRRSAFVAPDNGVLTAALVREEPVHAVELANPRYRLPSTSATFHGRDLFAPAAAHLASGVPLSDLGPPAPDLIALPWPRPEPQAAGTLLARVLHVDRFGNLVLNLRPDDVSHWPRHQIVFELPGQRIVGLCQTFADVPPGAPLAYLGSSGFLELAVRQGSAAEEWAITAGMPIRVHRASV